MGAGVPGPKTPPCASLAGGEAPHSHALAPARPAEPRPRWRGRPHTWPALHSVHGRLGPRSVRLAWVTLRAPSLPRGTDAHGPQIADPEQEATPGSAREWTCPRGHTPRSITWPFTARPEMCQATTGLGTPCRPPSPRGAGSRVCDLRGTGWAREMESGAEADGGGAGGGGHGLLSGRHKHVFNSGSQG